MQVLEGKKILLFSPKFFGYEEDIKMELEKFGAYVKLYDERPKNTFLTKVLIRLNLKRVIQKSINKYYDEIKKTIENKNFNYLFLLNVETIPFSFIEYIKLKNPDIKIYTYFWDSIANRKQSLKYLNISDRFFTFDPADSQVDNRILFLPLFYNNEYKSIRNKNEELLYDISFIGTLHSDRYDLVKNILKLIDKKDFFIYFFSTSKILFLFQKIFDKNFKKVKKNEVSFLSLSKKQTVELVSKSKVIIDIEHLKQKGLTMRTLEMLGSNKKIITTNKEVLNYDFFDENNICVIDRNNPIINKSFFESDFRIIDEEIYNKYSINKWVETIFKDFDE